MNSVRTKHPLYDPLTIGAIGAGISAIAGVGGGVMQYTQAQGQAEAAEQQAEAQRAAQKANEVVFREDADSLLGSQVAAAASQGMDVDSRSLLEILTETERRYQRDRRRREFNTEVGARQSENVAAADRARGANQLTGSLLETAAGAAGDTYSLLRD